MSRDIVQSGYLEVKRKKKDMYVCQVRGGVVESNPSRHCRSPEGKVSLPLMASKIELHLSHRNR